MFERLLKEYNEEKKILERQLKSSSSNQKNTLTTSDIMETIDELKKLKHYGKDLADAIEEALCPSENWTSDEMKETFFSASSPIVRKFKATCDFVKKGIRFFTK